MAKYLKLFNNHSGYTAFTQTEEFVKPNVSYCISENEVHYNPLPIWGAVDLGLPSGTLWATKNIGATTEMDYGQYFAWGETTGYTADQVSGTATPHKDFSWTDYKYANGAENKLTKYCTTIATTFWDGDGNPDGLTTLTESDDAAFVLSGGQYRMPTKDEYYELLSGTTSGFLSGGTFTLYAWNGHVCSKTKNIIDLSGTRLGDAVGYIFFKDGVSDYTSAISNYEYAFFPSAGSCRNGSILVSLSYWINSLYERDPLYGSGPSYAYIFDLSVMSLSPDIWTYRSNGFPIRGVLNQ